MVVATDMFRNVTFAMILVLLLGLAAACSSVGSRIKEQQAQFNALPEQAQAQIQNGRIDHGFTEEMVYMAKGKPDDIDVVTRDGKKLTVWKYAKRDYSGNPNAVSGGLSTPYGYPTFGPGAAQPVPTYSRMKYLRVEFENGRVVGWDRELQEQPPEYTR